MASYKVPQDVEAEDKLIGPFSFRQFIYLGVVAMAIGAGWGLSLIFVPLAVIPLPIVVFFGALALPLRKDQPMETYLAAMIQFILKPRQRMWMADGVVSRITIDIPTVIERRLVKDITGAQAISQFDYLSQIADSGGWSTRGIAHAPMAVTDNINNPEYDIMDSANTISHDFDARLATNDSQRRDDLLARIHSGTIVDEVTLQTTATATTRPVPIPAPRPQDYVVPAASPYSTATAYNTPTADSTPDTDDMNDTPVFNPLPNYMQQHVIQPASAEHKAVVAPAHEPKATKVREPEPVEEPVQYSEPEPIESVATPAIMELAKDVSVETIARQLHHEEVERNGDEVVINLH